VIECGCIRISCQIIDKWLLYKYYNLNKPIPTKADIETKYREMLEKLFQRHIYKKKLLVTFNL